MRLNFNGFLGQDVDIQAQLTRPAGAATVA
jgi:hypothetical protein